MPPPRAWGGADPRADHDVAWPIISSKPTLPATQLGAGDGSLFTVAGMLTPAECAALVKATSAAGFDVQGSRGPAAGEAVRSCGRLAVVDAAFAKALWRALERSIVAALPATMRDDAVGLNPNVRIYRYAPGDVFKLHYDDSDAIDDAHATQYTLLVYLTACGGGETRFFAEGGPRRAPKLVAAVAPSPGLALLHAHGDACLPHEGALVRAGEKYVLRSDVVFKRRR